MKLGVPSQHIHLTEGSGDASATGQSSTSSDKGFWDELKDFFLPEEDRYSYAEGLKRGGYLLTVRTEQGLYNQADVG